MVVAGGGAWRAVDQGVFEAGEGPAFQPWKDWRAHEARGPLPLVSAAILAANAHNTQPWRFRVDGSSIDLFADTSRDIGTVDPVSREMQIGLGCALENLLLAAGAGGYDYQLALMPDAADPDHAARVDLRPGSSQVSPLYQAIGDRHTNRYPYDTSRPLPAGTLQHLAALNDDPEVAVVWFASPEQRRRVGGLLVEATKAMNADQRQSADNIDRWLRQDWDAVQAHRDGMALDNLGLSRFDLIAAKLLWKPSEQTSAASWLATERRQTATAAAFGILAARDYRDPAQRLRVGRLWQRMHLWLTGQGLAAQPMNQLHERADREAQLGIAPRFGDTLQDLVGDPAWRAIFTFRLGYPTRPAAPSPRRSAQAVMAATA